MTYCFHPQVSLFELSPTIFSLLWVECRGLKVSIVTQRVVGAVALNLCIDLYLVLPG
jgi:hypothetical protein